MLTYYPSEFSKIRLQYNYDHRDLVGDDHSVWMQFEFLLGSHAAGFVKAVTTQPARLLLIVDVPRLIGEEALHA